MPVKFKDSININDEYTLPLVDGVSGNVLVTDGAGNVSFTTVSATDAEATHLEVKNTSGATIAKGTPVYITGNVGNTNKLEIAVADPNDVAKMPAVGVLESDLINNAEGFVTQGGYLKGIATATIDGVSTTSNDTIYIKAGGGFTTTKPTGGALIQNIGKVARVHASNGSIIVSSILRTNDVPAPLYVDHTNQRVGIGSTSPDTTFHVFKGSAGEVAQITGAVENRGLSIRSETNTDASAKVVFNSQSGGSKGMFSFETDGTEKMTIDSSGNVGIGTDTPVGNLFVGSDYNTTYGSTDLYIKASGGRTNYDPNLQNTSDLGITISKTSTNTSGPDKVGVTLYNDDDTAGGFSPMLLFAKRESDSTKYKATMAGIYARSPLGQGNGGSWIDGELIFATAGAASSGIKQRMVINKEGNVGIGTNSPSATLDVDGASIFRDQLNVDPDGNPNNVLSLNARVANDYSNLVFRNGVGTANWAELVATPNTLAIKTNSVERLRIASGGKVGIGTDSPNKKVHIKGSGDSDTTISIERTDLSNLLSVGNNYIGSFSDNEFRLFSNSTERMRIDSSGNVGIGTTSPSEPLDVVGTAKFDNSITEGTHYVGTSIAHWGDGDNNITFGTDTQTFNVNNGTALHINPEGHVGIGTNASSAYGLNISYSNDNSNDDYYFAQRLRGNFSGADTTDGDREQGGLFIDIDSSADGDASNEHRLYGIYSDVRFTGFSDVAHGAFNRVESNNNTEVTSQMVATYSFAVHDTNSTGGVSSLLGALSHASVDDDGDVANATGAQGIALVPSGRTSDVKILTGVRGEVQIDSPNAINYGNATAVEAFFDNNEGSTPTGTNTFLFRGIYGGTRYATNVYGLYVEGNKNYLEGSLGIGTTTPARELEVEGEGNVYIRVTARTDADSTAIELKNTQETWQIRNEDTNDNALEFLDDSGTQVTFKRGGNVGIGNNSPTRLLTIGDGTGSPNIQILASTAGNSRIEFGDSNDSDAGELQYVHSDNSMRFTTNGSEAMRIKSDGNVGIGGGAISSKLFVNTDTVGDSYFKGGADNSRFLDFSTFATASPNAGHLIDATSTNGEIGFATGGTERIRIDNSGNVGIGTTSPSQKLEVLGNIKAGAGAADNYISAIHSDGAETRLHGYGIYMTRAINYIRPTVDNTKILYIGTASQQWLTLSLDAATTQFSSNGSENMRISSSGNVGIGTITPSTKLQVNGVITATGGNSTNWNTAYGWGDHSSAGYLTSGTTTLDSRYYTESEIATFTNRSYIGAHTAVNLAVGWYTIATNTGDRASARFGIWDTNSGDHQSVTFYAAHHYGQNASNTLTVIDNSYYAGNPFRYIRIKDGGTYDGAALQIYIDDASNQVATAILGDNFQSSGWVLCDWVADATTPPNVSNYSSFAERGKVDLNNIAQGGFATTGHIYSGGDTTQYRNYTTNDTAAIADGGTGIATADQIHTFVTGQGFITSSSPAAPTNLVLSVVGQTINVTFTASTTSGINNYLVFGSVSGGDYGLISVIPPADFGATMSIIDDSFDATGTQAYRVYAVKNGVYSSPLTGSQAYSVSSAEPTNLSVINLNSAYYVQWDPPSSNARFVTAYNVYKHEHATQGSLSRSSASLIYSGLNTSYMYQISGANNTNYHQFWVETTIT